MPGIEDCKCILLIGGTSGIGQALAYALLDLSSKPTVIVGGRRKERLAEMKRERLETLQVDINADAPKLKAFVDETIQQYPDTDAIILCAGIQRSFDFTSPEKVDPKVISEEFHTNYIAPVTIITYFLPHFLKLSSEGRSSFVIPVTSGLAMCPMTTVPNYCASKAALHSFSTTLSVQLSDTRVQVMEIMPPLVESELHDQQGTTEMLSKFWMPLQEFTEKEVAGLRGGKVAIPVGTAEKLYETYQEKAKLDQVIQMHQQMKSHHK